MCIAPQPAHQQKMHAGVGVQSEKRAKDSASWVHTAPRRVEVQPLACSSSTTNQSARKQARLTARPIPLSVRMSHVLIYRASSIRVRKRKHFQSTFPLYYYVHCCCCTVLCSHTSVIIVVTASHCNTSVCT